MAANSKKTAIRRGPGRPFRKGQSGNPSGRPKRTGKIAEEILAYLDSEDCEDHSKTNLQALIERLYIEDPKILLYYAYGKPREIHEVSNAEPTIDDKLIAAARALALSMQMERENNE